MLLGQLLVARLGLFLGCGERLGQPGVFQCQPQRTGERLVVVLGGAQRQQQVQDAGGSHGGAQRIVPQQQPEYRRQDQRQGVGDVGDQHRRHGQHAAHQHAAQHQRGEALVRQGWREDQQDDATAPADTAGGAGPGIAPGPAVGVDIRFPAAPEGGDQRQPDQEGRFQQGQPAQQHRVRYDVPVDKRQHGRNQQAGDRTERSLGIQ